MKFRIARPGIFCLLLLLVNLLVVPVNAVTGAAALQLAPPAQLGFNQEMLARAVNRIGLLDGVNGLLVIRNNKLAVEQYFRDGGRDKAHNIKSASKVVLSALAGIAIEEGLLRLDQSISDLPQFKKINDPKKSKITIRHLLTMTSGLLPTSYQAYNVWTSNDDWVKAALERPLVAEPGSSFQYSTGDTHLLSAVLTAATGMSTQKYAEKKLFGPLNIEIKGWETDPQGINIGGNDLSLLPRDLARFGQLYLHGGRFNDRQLIPGRWVNESTRADRPGIHEVYGAYGYLWYTASGFADAFLAVGYGGQYLYVLPKYDCVIVLTSTIDSKGLPWTRELFEHLRLGIIGSIETDRHDQAFAAQVRNYRARMEKGRVGRATANIILRQEPDRESKKIGLVPMDSEVTILAGSGQWLRVRFAENEGWLHRDYVQTAAAPDPGPASQVEPFIDATGTNNARAGLTIDLLNLRAGPSQDDTVIITLSPHTFLEILERKENWLRVQTGKLKGWVDARYVSLVPLEQTGQLTDKKSIIDSNITLEPAHSRVAPAEKPKPAARADDSEQLQVLARQLQDQQRLAEKTRQELAGLQEMVKAQSQAAIGPADSEQLQVLARQLQDQQRLAEKTRQELAGLQDMVKAQSQAAIGPADSDKRREQDLASIRQQITQQDKSMRDFQLGLKDLLFQLTLLRNDMNKHEELPKQDQLDQNNLKNNLANHDYPGAELDDLRKEVQAQKNNAALAESTWQTLNKELEGIRQQMALLNKKQQADQVARLKTSDELSALRNDLYIKQLDSSSLLAERGKQETNLAAANERISTLQKEIASLKSTAEQELALFKKQIENMNSEILAARQNREALSTRLQELQLDRQDRTQEKASAEIANQVALAEIEKMRKQLDSLRTSLAADAQKNLQGLSSELAAIKAELQARPRDDIGKELASVRQQIAAVKEMLEETQKSNKKNLLEMAKLNRELDQQRQITLNLAAARQELPAGPDAAPQLSPPSLPVSGQAQPASQKEPPVVLATDNAVKPASSGKMPSTLTETQPLLDLTGIEQFVTSWAEAWSRQDVKAYLAHYADNYQPPGRMTLSQWQQQRRDRLEKPSFIEVKAEGLQKQKVDELRAQVSFKQYFKSDTYQDQVLKTLVLSFENGSWKISSELSR